MNKDKKIDKKDYKIRIYHHRRSYLTEKFNSDIEDFNEKKKKDLIKKLY